MVYVRAAHRRTYQARRIIPATGQMIERWTALPRYDYYSCWTKYPLRARNECGAFRIQPLYLQFVRLRELRSFSIQNPFGAILHLASPHQRSGLEIAQYSVTTYFYWYWNAQVVKNVCSSNLTFKSLWKCEANNASATANIDYIVIRMNVGSAGFSN